MLFNNQTTQKLSPLAIDGKLIINASPWQFAIETQTTAMSSQYLKIKICAENTGEYLNPLDINEFIDEGDEVSVQLDDERFKYAVPTLACTIIGKGLISDFELQLELKLQNYCEELNSTIDEINNQQFH